jgi:carboxylesterase type B
MKTSLAALLALLEAVAAAPSQRKAPTARVKNGTVSGLYSSAYDQDFFLGVPFAQPPLGDLRFRQAQSLNAIWTSVRDATEYAHHCVGYGVKTSFPCYKSS